MRIILIAAIQAFPQGSNMIISCIQLERAKEHCALKIQILEQKKSPPQKPIDSQEIRFAQFVLSHYQAVLTYTPKEESIYLRITLFKSGFDALRNASKQSIPAILE